MEADMVMSPCVFRPEGFDPLLSATKTAVCVVECAFLRFHWLAALCLARHGGVHLPNGNPSHDILKASHPYQIPFRTSGRRSFSPCFFADSPSVTHLRRSVENMREKCWALQA